MRQQLPLLSSWSKKRRRTLWRWTGACATMLVVAYILYARLTRTAHPAACAVPQSGYIGQGACAPGAVAWAAVPPDPCHARAWAEFLGGQRPADRDYHCAYHAALAHRVCVTTHELMPYVANLRVLSPGILDRLGTSVRKRMEQSAAFPGCPPIKVARRETARVTFTNAAGATVSLDLAGDWAMWAQHVASVFDGSFAQEIASVHTRP